MFHKYPYTDFHELNLDGLLAEWKKFLNEYDDVRAQVKDLESAFESLKDFVNNYFDNLDVQEEINNKLDEMAESGELEEILQRLVEYPQVMTLNPFLSVSMYRGYLDLNAEASHPSFMQSACTDGVNTYMFFMNPVNVADGIVRKYNNESKVLVGENTLSGIYHANGCDYYEGVIYLATIEGYSILEIDSNTLNIIATHTFDIGFGGVTIDNDGTAYATSGNRIYRINLEDNTYTLVSTYQITNSAYQSGVVRDGWFYTVGVNPSCVYRIRVNSGEVNQIYPIDRYVDIYCVGEAETIFNNRLNGKYYVASTSYYNFSNYRQGNIFECDFSSNTAPKRIYSGGSVLSVGAIYVNSGNAGGLPDGTQANPFPNLSAALSAWNSPALNMYKTFQIILLTDCPDEILYIRNNTINLNGGGHRIGQVYAMSSNINLTNVVVQKTNVAESSIVYPVYCNGSRCDFEDIVVNADTVGGYENYSVVFNECVGTWFSGNILNTLKCNMYRSSMFTNVGLRPMIHFEPANNPNLFLTREDAAAMTQIQIDNASVSSCVFLRVYRGSNYTDVSFPPETSAYAQAFFVVNGALEVHTIHQTYDASSGYTYEDASAKIIADVSNGGVTLQDTAAAGLGRVQFISRSM